MTTIRSPRAAAVHHVVRALILGGIAFYIIHLNRGDALTLYIAPRMIVYVKLAALALYVIAAAQLFQAIRTLGAPRHQAPVCADCGHDHAYASSSSWKTALLYGLFVIPLVVGFVTPDTTIGSAMAANKGMNLSTSTGLKKDAAASPSTKDGSGDAGRTSGGADGTATANDNEKAAGSGGSAADGSGSAADGSGSAADGNGTVANSGGSGTNGSDAAANSGGSADVRFPSDEFTAAYAKYAEKLYAADTIEIKEKDYIETLTTLDLYLDQFVGKKVSIGGFVYREDGMEPTRFIVGRFAIQCCTADALPYGVIADFPHASDYKTDTWIKATGVLRTTEYKGNTVMKLDVSKVEVISAAADPYVYPDLDFGM